MVTDITLDKDLLANVGIPVGQADALALIQLAKAEGYPATGEGVLALIEEAITDSVVPGICVDCHQTQECEPDARTNWCENCGQMKVRSCLDLAMLI